MTIASLVLLMSIRIDASLLTFKWFFSLFFFLYSIQPNCRFFLFSVCFGCYCFQCFWFRSNNPSVTGKKNSGYFSWAFRQAEKTTNWTNMRTLFSSLVPCLCSIWKQNIRLLCSTLSIVFQITNSKCRFRYSILFLCVFCALFRSILSSYVI